MKNRIYEVYALEQLAAGNTCVHRMHPLVKLLAAAVFIVTVVSFDRHAPGRLIPYILYPVFLMALSETPYSMLFKRFLIALPFCLFAGISNVIFDRTAAYIIGGATVTWGTVSLFTILLRTCLCVMAVFLLISTTPFSELTNEMRRLRLPNIFIIMFELTYRYIGVLLSEGYSMIVAYALRNTKRKGIEIRDMGSFAGQLLVRSFDRADRIYNAMKCRGYALQNKPHNNRKPVLSDVVFLSCVCVLCVVFRLFDVNIMFAGILGRYL